MNQTASDVASAIAPDRRLIVVSMDSHVSAPVDAYRPFCDRQYKDELDTFIAHIDEHRIGATDSAGPGAAAGISERRDRYLARLEKEYGSDELNSDLNTRLRIMDEDGIAAEVIYHGGHNGQPIPFFGPTLHGSFGQTLPEEGRARHLRLAGLRMYNRWLADWIQPAPERLIGLAHIPFWDVALSVEEVKRAYRDGLRGVNLPAPRHGVASYNDPVWDPFWAVCCELGLALHTHGGGGDRFSVDGPGAYPLMATELFFAARRAMPQLIFGGVFERFPELRLVLTEQTGEWVMETLNDFDSVYFSPLQERTVPFLRDVIPHKPSDYFRSNCYIGASFMARFEAESAIENDYWPNMAWGRDFPHPESTWPYTIESLRATFAGLPREKAAAMIGGNAVRFLQLDGEKLSAVADRIGPTAEEIDEPLLERPEGSDISLGFRTIGSFA